MSAAPRTERARLLGHGLRLEYLTVGWNVVEGAVAIAAALAAGSVALLGFGVDSFVESASGLVLVWRHRAEHRGSLDEEAMGRVERRAERLVVLSLLPARGPLWAGFAADEGRWSTMSATSGLGLRWGPSPEHVLQPGRALHDAALLDPRVKAEDAAG